jgi:hypothetical protein
MTVDKQCTFVAKSSSLLVFDLAVNGLSSKSSYLAYQPLSETIPVPRSPGLFSAR